MSAAASSAASPSEDPDTYVHGAAPPRLWSRAFIDLLIAEALFGFSYAQFVLLPKLLTVGYGATAGPSRSRHRPGRRRRAADGRARPRRRGTDRGALRRAPGVHSLGGLRAGRRLVLPASLPDRLVVAGRGRKAVARFRAAPGGGD